MKKVKNKLRVNHFAQVPCKPFIVDVKDEEDAKRIIDILTHQHLFLYDNHIIPDYANVIIVTMFDKKENEWVDYYNEEEEMEWNEFEETYLQPNSQILQS